MSKIDLVRQEMMAALKNHDTERKEALSLLLAALKAKFIDKRADLTEDEENAVVYREIKQAQETIESVPADRTAIIDECKQRIAVFSEFAPQRMSADEINAAIDGILSQLGLTELKPQQKGLLMKQLMPLVKGKADGTLVNQLVEARLVK